MESLYIWLFLTLDEIIDFGEEEFEYERTNDNEIGDGASESGS